MLGFCTLENGHPVEKTPWHIEENHHQPLQQGRERLLLKAEGNEAQRNEDTSPRSQSKLGSEPGLEVGSPSPLSGALPLHNKAEVFMD